MDKTIISALKDIEIKNNCKILYACESGSRAWEFPSQDSDFDVRFIYIKPVEAYLTLTETPDTINCFLPNDLDLSGWDLKKSLVHFGKSNMCLYEWLDSPIIYCDKLELRSTLKQLIPTYMNLIKGYHHYYSLAIKKHDEFFKNNHGSIKKLFYSLRCIIAAQWIIKKQTMPHTSFIENLNGVDIDKIVLEKIRALIQIKAKSNENHEITPDPIIVDWVAHMLNFLDPSKHDLPSASTNSMTLLNDLFLKILRLAGFFNLE